MPFLFKLFYRFKAISIKIAPGFFIDIVKLILKFIWKAKGTKRAKAILGKKKEVEKSQYSILRLIYGDRNQISGFLGMGAGIQKDQRKDTKGHREGLGVVDRFIILFEVLVL